MKISFPQFLLARLPLPLRGLVLNWRQLRKSSVHEGDFELFTRLRDLDLLCLDVGAHRGESSIALLSRLPKARVIAFEPNPLSRLPLSYLKRRFPARFAVELLALSDGNAEALLHTPVSGGMAHTSSASLEAEELAQPHVRARLRREAGGSGLTRFTRRPVRAASLDGFRLAPDVVKIDVEGSEARVLAGARETLASHHPLLMIEFNHHQRFFPLLASLGYRFFRYESSSGVLLPYEEGLHPLNVFALHANTRRDIIDKLPLR